jgi:tetratricopeptide (TPR) repeat protein
MMDGLIMVKALLFDSSLHCFSSLRWLIVVASLLSLPPATVAASDRSRVGDDEMVADRNEPKVTQEEAGVLEKTEETAKTDLGQAIDMLRKAITLDSSPALDFALASYLHEKGDTDRAVTALREALNKMPAFHRARENLAKMLLQENEYAAAAKELVRLLESDVVGKQEFWRMLGYAYLADSKPLAAETAYRNALVFAPEDPELLILLIRTMMEQGKLSETRLLVREALADTPLREELWKLLANIDMTSGKQYDALVSLECAYRLGIAGGEVLVTLGDLYLEQGLANEALTRFQETTAMDHPPVSRLLSAIEALVYQKNTREARAMLSTMKKVSEALTAEHRMKLRYLEARVAEAEGDLKEALRCYRQLLDEDPLDGVALLATGYILQKQEEYEEALIYYERAARTSPENEAQSLIRQAQIAVERADYRKAAQLLERSLEIRPVSYVERYLEQVRRMLE